MSIVDCILNAGSVGGPWMNLSSGQIRVFKDDNWQSPNFTITLSNYPENSRNYVGDSWNDTATYVAFNLPVGMVCTLMDNLISLKDGQNPADWSDCGRTFDLVGKGYTQYVNLCNVNLNDCFSAFTWRWVNLDMGFVEVFDDCNFGGNRSVIFLSEWPAGQTVSISRWWLQDRISSMRWPSLTFGGAGVASVYWADNTDGSGNPYYDCSCSNTSNQAGLVPFNDCFSSFKWTRIQWDSQQFEPFKISFDQGTLSATTQTFTKSNPFDTDLSVTQNLGATSTGSVAYTISKSKSSTSTVESSVTSEVGEEGVGKVSATYTFSFSQTESKEESTTTLNESSIQNNCSITYTIPAKSAPVSITLTAYFATLTNSTHQVKVTRWYTIPVVGSVQDGKNASGAILYKRVETDTVMISATLNALVQVSQKPDAVKIVAK
jgi:hypothetical protein